MGAPTFRGLNRIAALFPPGDARNGPRVGIRGPGAIVLHESWEYNGQEISWQLEPAMVLFGIKSGNPYFCPSICWYRKITPASSN